MQGMTGCTLWHKIITAHCLQGKRTDRPSCFKRSSTEVVLPACGPAAFGSLPPVADKAMGRAPGVVCELDKKRSGS
jgi:hypothetical protein